MGMACDKDQLRLQLGRALNVITATSGYKSFESLLREYKNVENEFITMCGESDILLEIRQRVSERIFSDAVGKVSAVDDLEHYYLTAAGLGFSCADTRISLTILYCQSLMNNNRVFEAKKNLGDLLDYVHAIEDATPGTFIRETFVSLESLISQCEEEL